MCDDWTSVDKPATRRDVGDVAAARFGRDVGEANETIDQRNENVRMSGLAAVAQLVPAAQRPLGINRNADPTEASLVDLPKNRLLPLVKRTYRCT